MNLINNILDFSKVKSGRMELEQLNIDLRQLLEDTASMFAPQAIDAGLDLTCSIDPEVPLYQKGDPGRVRQVVTNLIGNALKFTKRGGVVGIRTALSSEDDTFATVLFEIHDTGIGIAESRLKAIFEPFTQASGATARKYGGTGLGLAICRQLTEVMEGEIGVSSIEGKGSTFWFTVPFMKCSDSELRQLELHSKELEGVICSGVTNHKFRILLAEDSIINQKVAQAMLQKLGYKCDAVADGQEAVRALEMIYYDLVLMDCQMQEMSGFEATAIIRDNESKVLNHSVPIIAMTSFTMKGDREKCIEAGMSDYLAKPVHKSQLDQMLLKWLIS